MSHRKYEQPRNGSLGFLPRKRAARHRGKIRGFPKDDASKPVHLTAFLGYKVGMTHISREVDRPGSALHKGETVEAVTILETPPMIGVGLVGYIETPRGLRALTTVWTQHLSEGLRRRFYKNWFRSREKAFTRYAKQNFNEKGERSASLEREIARIGRHCTVVRLLAHTQVHKTGLRLKKAHLLEVQINGGSVADKIAYGLKFFEQEIPVKDVFSMDEMIDTIGVTSGHGFKGCVQRWGVKKLPRKTHRGNRKVACVGSWHPSRIRITQPRAGQMGYHHRTEVNKKVYWVGAPMYDKEGKVVSNAKTDADPSEKTINPLGGWVGYPNIRGEWLMIKGTCPGVRKRPITLRKTLLSQHSSRARENVVVKHVDTAAKYGHGRFQTKTEKNAFFGPTKHNPAA